MIVPGGTIADLDAGCQGQHVVFGSKGLDLVFVFYLQLFLSICAFVMQDGFT